MTAARGDFLIRDLLEDPQGFHEGGGTYNLLQEYFAGLPLETLRSLLRSSDMWIQRSASFIASELGKQSQPLIEDVIPLLESSDRHVQNYAMEVLTVCCEGKDAELFGHVIRKLESDDEGLRLQAMDLIANADVEQIKAAVSFFEGRAEQARHQRGLRALAADRMTPDEIEGMLQDPDPLIQCYGAVAKKRLKDRRNAHS